MNETKQRKPLHLGYVKVLTIALAFIVVGVSALLFLGRENDIDDPIFDDDVDYTPTRTVTETKLVVYEGPRIMQSSNLAHIHVENQALFVYETLVNHSRVFSYSYPTTKAPVAIFDFEGAVEVRVTIPDETELESAIVRPLAYEIDPVIEGNTITFILEYPTSYVVEYNGNTNKAIHLFAQPIEEDTPDPNNLPENMIYIGPGVHKADAIPVSSNQTVYIAGGAVVYGQIRTENVENVTVRGRGIIDGSIYHRRNAGEYTIPIEFRHSQNMTIEGITFLNSAGWTIASYFVDGLVMNHVNIITARANGDGISIQSSRNVHVKNTFVRTWDDSLVVKNYNRGTSENILFENVTLWTDLAQSMEIGYETYGATMDNIVFRDITVLHNFHKPIISIHNADDAAITNVIFRNITVENAQMIGDNWGSSHDNFLIDFQIQYNLEWSRSGGNRGSINGVLIENVHVLDGHDDIVSRIAGYDETHRISNVTIRNVMMKGTPVTAATDLAMTLNSHVSNVRFEYTAEEPQGAILRLPYILELADDEVELMMISNIDQEGFLVPSFAIGEIPTLYMGSQVSGDFTVTATRGTSLFNWDDGSGSFSQPVFPASHTIDDDTSTIWKGGNFTGESGEFAALSIVFDESKRLGTVRIYGDINSNIYQLQNIAIFAIRSDSATSTFVRLTNSENYEFSPARGNYVDININPGEYDAIQIRFYHRDGHAYPEVPFASEVALYPASLSFNKGVTATTHEDVYVASNITDGNRFTYYESKKPFPAEIVIDLDGVFNLNVISIHLPPLMQWELREQEIEILVSLNGVDYDVIVAKDYFTFDPSTANVMEITLNEPASAQYVKFIFTANTAPGNYGAQVSQINIFE